MNSNKTTNAATVQTLRNARALVGKPVATDHASRLAMMVEVRKITAAILAK